MSDLRMWDDDTVKILNNSSCSSLRFVHVGHNRTPDPTGLNASFRMDDTADHMHQLVENVTSQKHVSAVIDCGVRGGFALRYAMIFPKDVNKIISIATPRIVVPENAKTLWPQRIEAVRDEQSGEDILCHASVQRGFPGAWIGRCQSTRTSARACENLFSPRLSDPGPSDREL